MMTNELGENTLKINHVPAGSRLVEANEEGRRLPNFFIDTILEKLPTNLTSNRINGEVSNPAWNNAVLPKNNQVIPSRPITERFQTFSDYFYTRNYLTKYVQLLLPPESFRYLPSQQNQVQIQSYHSGNKETNFSDKFAGERSLYFWHQNLFSTISKNELRERWNAPANIQKPFSFKPTVVHFDIEATTNLNIDQSSGVWRTKQAQSSDKVSLKNSETAVRSSVEAADILLQLNKLSEKIPFCNETTENKTQNFPAVSRQNGPELAANNLNTRSQESSSSRALNSANEDQHPAWVFCTRYSDRPCAGPRIRRTKKGFHKKAPTNVKRERTAFSEPQLTQLQKEFKDCPYLTEERRIRLSNDLGLSVAQIKVWFQNKRAKVKKASGIQSRLKIGLIASGIYEHGTIMTNDNA